MQNATTRAAIEREIARLSSSFSQNLNFERTLEAEFEETTAMERAHRLWLEGLIAIVLFNCCLLADDLMVRTRGEPLHVRPDAAGLGYGAKLLFPGDLGCGVLGRVAAQRSGGSAVCRVRDAG